MSLQRKLEVTTVLHAWASRRKSSPGKPPNTTMKYPGDFIILWATRCETRATLFLAIRSGLMNVVQPGFCVRRMVMAAKDNIRGVAMIRVTARGPSSGRIVPVNYLSPACAPSVIITDITSSRLAEKRSVTEKQLNRAVPLEGEPTTSCCDLRPSSTLALGKSTVKYWC